MLLIDLPATATYVLLNIGANVDPVLPPADNASVVVVAFEPMVPEKIPPHERLFVVPAAVAEEAGLSTMRPSASGGTASSLATLADMRINKLLSRSADAAALPPPRIVPIVPMRAVLDSLREDLMLWYLKTDMQVRDACTPNCACTTRVLT